jgi:hypothetical protein
MSQTMGAALWHREGATTPSVGGYRVLRDPTLKKTHCPVAAGGAAGSCRGPDQA